MLTIIPTGFAVNCQINMKMVSLEKKTMLGYLILLTGRKCSVCTLTDRTHTGLTGIVGSEEGMGTMYRHTITSQAHFPPYQHTTPVGEMSLNGEDKGLCVHPSSIKTTNSILIYNQTSTYE